MPNPTLQEEENPSTDKKSENYNRRNFLQISAASVVTLGVTKAAEAKTGKSENNGLSKTSASTQEATDHGELSGLSDDDHQQYLNDDRANERFYQKEEINLLLEGKEAAIAPGGNSQYLRGDKTFRALDKTTVGLSNVNNTSDANKPISAAAQSALNNKVNISEKNQSNGFVGLNENGKINPAHIADLVSPQNGQVLLLREGAIINVSETYRRLDTEFGVVADDSANNAAAIQTALDAVRDSTGGTLVFPNGITKIAGNSAVNMLSKQGAIRLLGSGGNSVIHLAGGSTGIAFDFANTPNVTVEGLTFIGTPGNYVLDFTQAALSFSWVEQVTIRDCQFLGLSVSAPYDEPSRRFELNKNHGIIVCYEGDLLIERCVFGGTATGNCPNVGVTSWNGLTIRDSQFLDYGYYKNLTVSKTGGITNTYWVRAINPKPVTDARKRGKILIENTIFDEANVHAIYLFGAQWVELDSLSINGGIYAAFVLMDVQRASIKDTFVGHTNTTHSLHAFRCGVIQIDNLLHGGNVKYIELAPGTQKLISRYSTLVGGPAAANGVINNAGASVQIIN